LWVSLGCSIPPRASAGEEQVQDLLPDLVPYLSSESASVLVMRVERLDTKRVGRQERGEVILSVVRVLRGERLARGVRIGVPFRRRARVEERGRLGYDQWNALSWTPGDLLLFALGPGTVAGSWRGLAALRVEHPEDPSVAAAERCLRVEAFRGSAVERERMLADLLRSREDLAWTYAADAVGRLLSRTAGIEVLARAISSPEVTATAREHLVGVLTGITFYQSDLGAEPGNVLVVRTLAGRVTAEADPERRARVIQYLASCVLCSFSTDEARDRSTRRALIGGVLAPPPEEVQAALSSQLLLGGEEDERAVIRQLSEAWQASTR
jgi:hypothetical protein